jgi:hypothetical protein
MWHHDRYIKYLRFLLEKETAGQYGRQNTLSTQSYYQPQQTS